jgi:hypothetical protein
MHSGFADSRLDAGQANESVIFMMQNNHVTRGA